METTKRTRKAFAIAAVMALALLPTVAIQAYKGETFTSGDLKYTIISDPASGKNGTVSVSLNTKSASSVTIPASVQGEYKSIPIIGSSKTGTFDVTEIAKNGFTFATGGWLDNGYEVDDGCGHTYSISDYKNTALQSVTFESPSKITKIGAYAFSGCDNLKSFTIPSSVTELGEYALSACTSMTVLNFQTDSENRTQLKELPEGLLYCCFAITSLDIPEGITTIGDKALQQNHALKTIKLPNTLERMGSHFLCNAMQLTTLTIPASVTYIDGAFLHGCESLSSVYLLGPASTLKPSTSDGTTFGANESWCASEVSQCTFYTTWDYKEGYTTDDVWKQLDENNNDKGNKFSYPIPGTDREFKANKWVTAIFPHEVKNYKEIFGEGAMIARIYDAKRDEKDQNLYHVRFILIPGDDIPANRPLMFYCDKEVKYQMYSEADQTDPAFKLNMTKRWTESVTADDGAIVNMFGKYMQGEKLVQWEFYFMNNKFWRVPNDDNGVTMGSCRCWWNINRDGVRTPETKLSNPSINGGTNGIYGLRDGETKVDVEIFDLGGRRIPSAAEMIPGNVYVVNGKQQMAR